MAQSVCKVTCSIFSITITQISTINNNIIIIIIVIIVIIIIIIIIRRRLTCELVETLQNMTLKLEITLKMVSEKRMQNI